MLTTQQILNSLNSGGLDEWIISPDDQVRALTTVTRDESGKYNFNPASGVLVKVFFNTRTLEIKLFVANAISDAFNS